jgi:hypothetical protein
VVLEVHGKALFVLTLVASLKSLGAQRSNYWLHMPSANRNVTPLGLQGFGCGMSLGYRTSFFPCYFPEKSLVIYKPQNGVDGI